MKVKVQKRLLVVGQNVLVKEVTHSAACTLFVALPVSSL